MIKKTLLIAAMLTMGLAANAQGTQKDFIGRWRTHFSNGNYSDMMFFADGTGALLLPGGLLEAYISIKYPPAVKDGVIKLQYTYDIHRKKNPNYGAVAIKLVNDSTFIYSLNASLLAHPDTSNRKLLVYRKIKIDDPDTRLRLPNHHDLIGTWTFYHVKKNPGMSVVFLDNRHVWFKTGDTAKQLNYRVDFSKQPIPIDFFADRDSTKILPAYLMFDTVGNGENVLRLELFPQNKRGDHFTKLGKNALFVKKD